MENKDIIKNLSVVCSILNQTDVRGKQNMLNISGSIDVLETIIKKLQQESPIDTSKETK